MTSTPEQLTQAFVSEAQAALDQEVRRIHHCLRQLTDEDVWAQPQEGMNSIGTIVMHLCGNLRQWFIAGIGGAEDVRDRPAEFSQQARYSKVELMDCLSGLAGEIHTVLGRVDADTLLAEKRIQGFATTCLSAIFSTLTHLEGHALQIVYATRLRLGNGYEDFWKPADAEQGGE